ncbi:MAG: EcsC family protein [Cellulosilyticum sp.]|nr:EcsC family protein [Cellulosilyticum sp.]
MQEILKKLLSNKYSVKDKALRDLDDKEMKFIKKYQTVEDSWIHQKLEDKVPEKLQEKLDVAFHKAFELVFEKGTGVIEKSYHRQDYEQTYQVNAYASKLKQNKKAMQTFSKEASKSRTKNLVISSIEGIGLGVLGIGIPDIPIFTGMMLKSIYEIALSYGFSYEEEEERLFILKVIEVALLHGEGLIQGNKILNEWIENGVSFDENQMMKQMTSTAKALSKEMLYMRFLQGIPIVGIVGGIADTVYLRKITAYTQLKYKRRFLKTSDVMKYY